MSKGRTRTSLAAAAAALFFWPTGVANPDPSDQRSGDPVAATRTLNELMARDRQLQNDRRDINFTTETIEKSQARIDPARGDAAAQVRDLEQLNAAHAARRDAWRRERNAFHGQILMAPGLSEADVSSFYAEGRVLHDTKDSTYSHHEMAYRDECRNDGHTAEAALKNCMTTRQDTEVGQRGGIKLRNAAGTLVVSLAGLYGAPFAAAAFGNLRRRRRQSQMKADGQQALDDVKTLLQPTPQRRPPRI